MSDAKQFKTIAEARQYLMMPNRCWSDTYCDCDSESLCGFLLDQYDAKCAEVERLTQSLLIEQGKLERADEAHESAWQRVRGWCVARQCRLQSALDDTHKRLAEAERERDRLRGYWLRVLHPSNDGITFDYDELKMILLECAALAAWEGKS